MKIENKHHIKIIWIFVSKVNPLPKSLNCKNSIFWMYWLCWVESGSLKIKDYGHWTHDNKLVTCWLFVCQKQDPINQKYDWEKRKSLLFVASTYLFRKTIEYTDSISPTVQIRLDVILLLNIRVAKKTPNSAYFENKRDKCRTLKSTFVVVVI